MKCIKSFNNLLSLKNGTDVACEDVKQLGRETEDAHSSTK